MARTESRIWIEDGAAWVELTRGYVAAIDTERVHLVAGYPWRAIVTPSGLVYAAADVSGPGGIRRTVYMHRVLSGCSDPDLHVDHRDGDTLNNRCVNLRPCTVSENARNRRLPRNNTSGYKGVHWCRASRRWIAKLKVHGREHRIGAFPTAAAAAEAYETAARRLHGEFMRRSCDATSASVA